MWVVPGINKEDYVKDIYVEFFYKIVLLGVFIIILQLIIFYLITRGITKQIKDFSSHFREFLSFITYKQNRIEKKKLEGNCEFSVMTKDINSAIDEFDDKFKHDMRVIGESVLTFDKLKKGIFKCRVNSNSSNPMINTLKNTINDALDDLENYMREIEKTLISYTSNDYKDRIVINDKIANPSRLLKVIQSVNSLGDTLATQAKNSLENGSSLETNSKTLKNSIENLTSKITKQIESLEETTLAVEKISEITNNNSKNTTSMSKLAEIVKQAVEDGYNLSNKTTKSMDDMYETMIAASGVGLAAIQIAVPLNVLIINPINEEDIQDKNDLIEAINPKITHKDGELVYQEGCLSVPGFYEDITRAKHIVVEYFNRFGEKQTMECEDFLAVAWQHEMEHLSGHVFIENLSFTKRQKFEKEWKNRKKSKK